MKEKTQDREKDLFLNYENFHISIRAKGKMTYDNPGDKWKFEHRQNLNKKTFLANVQQISNKGKLEKLTLDFYSAIAPGTGLSARARHVRCTRITRLETAEHAIPQMTHPILTRFSITSRHQLILFFFSF